MGDPDFSGCLVTFLIVVLLALAVWMAFDAIDSAVRYYQWQDHIAHLERGQRK